MDTALTSAYKGVVSLVDHKGKEPARCLDIGTGVRTYNRILFHSDTPGWLFFLCLCEYSRCRHAHSWPARPHEYLMFAP